MAEPLSFMHHDQGSSSERSDDSPSAVSEDDSSGHCGHISPPDPDWTEERFRVDRKKLETMLLAASEGRINGGEDFFQKDAIGCGGKGKDIFKCIVNPIFLKSSDPFERLEPKKAVKRESESRSGIKTYRTHSSTAAQRKHTEWKWELALCLDKLFTCFIPSEMFGFPSGMFDCVFAWFKVISVECSDVNMS
uniref:BicC family RNA binding protein 1 n=1 Tax=Cyprinus carpio carpio TaxID=630221 RepID=A0A9J7YK87_CYPCA